MIIDIIINNHGYHAFSLTRFDPWDGDDPDVDGERKKIIVIFQTIMIAR